VIFPDRTLAEMAEKRPRTLDDMARITGVGAKKLESFGTIFLAVINGAEDQVHPSRLRLAGRPEGQVFDRLADVQLDLARGQDGTGKYLSVTHSTLKLIAERRPSTLSELQRIQGMGDQKVERFGEAFLQVLREA
jgi:ATP-dependent DNA helicase RecQ